MLHLLLILSQGKKQFFNYGKNMPTTAYYHCDCKLFIVLNNKRSFIKHKTFLRYLEEYFKLL